LQVRFRPRLVLLVLIAFLQDVMPRRSSSSFVTDYLALHADDQTPCPSAGQNKITCEDSPRRTSDDVPSAAVHPTSHIYIFRSTSTRLSAL